MPKTTITLSRAELGVLLIDAFRKDSDGNETDRGAACGSFITSLVNPMSNIMPRLHDTLVDTESLSVLEVINRYPYASAVRAYGRIVTGTVMASAEAPRLTEVPPVVTAASETQAAA